MRTFPGRRVSCFHLKGPLISVIYTGAATFSLKLLLSYPHEAEWTPFQIHHISKYPVRPGIEYVTCESVATSSDQ
jgi:hypothetical protein